MERLSTRIAPAAEPTIGDDATISLAASAPLLAVVRRFWPDARPYRRWLAAALLLTALGPAIDTVALGLYGRLVDRVLVPRDLDPFAGIALAYLVLTLAGGLVSFGDAYLNAWLGERFLLDLRTHLFAHVQDLPPQFFERRRLGDLVARLTGDVAEIEDLLLSGPADAAAYLFRMLFFGAAMLALSWQLTLLTLVAAPVFWLSARALGRRIKAGSRDQRRWSGGIAAVAEESLTNALLVQAYNRQQTEVARFRREAQGHLAAQMTQTRVEALAPPLNDLIQLGGVLTIIAAGTWGLTHGDLSLGGLLIFVAYLNQLYAPVHGLSQLFTSISAASAGAERVIELLDEPSLVDEEAGIDALVAPRGVLAFDGVTFRYPGAARDTLRGASFRVAPGETLALVGESGAGKSTIVRLLLRFADPDAGSIRLDGNDLRDLTRHALREQLAVVLQETLLFDGTVRENIAYGRPGASEPEIVAAASAADAHDFIVSLPEGYETRVGPRGSRLSGGQRQRLAIARAMVRNAPILILDEPTTGLDAAASERLMAPLRRLMRGRTTIIVSHNLQLIREATAIAVLEQGRIVERGTHAELLERHGVYARLVRLHDATAAGDLAPPAQSLALLA